MDGLNLGRGIGVSCPVGRRAWVWLPGSVWFVLCVYHPWLCFVKILKFGEVSTDISLTIQVSNWALSNEARLLAVMCAAAGAMVLAEALAGAATAEAARTIAARTLRRLG